MNGHDFNGNIARKRFKFAVAGRFGGIARKNRRAGVRIIQIARRIGKIIIASEKIGRNCD